MKEVTPQLAFEAMQAKSGIIVDVRTQPEWVSGVIPDAHLFGRDHLEMRIQETIKDTSVPIYLICGSGVRSWHATYALYALGYSQVFSIAGGMTAWHAQDLPVSKLNSCAEA